MAYMLAADQVYPKHDQGRRPSEVTASARPAPLVLAS
jgi:hypothetical protein